MMNYTYDQDTYDTPKNTRLFLGDILAFKTRLYFYYRIIRVIIRTNHTIKKGNFSNGSWCDSSYYIFETLERCGGKLHIKGLNNISAIQGPVVFIANHMSTLETMILPGLICPKKPSSFIVKESLITSPLFGLILRAAQSIVVTRTDPIKDFKTVMSEGVKLLESGRSVIAFPQKTRGPGLIPEEFNSIGVKLAKKANVPVIPIAIKSDFWGNGKVVKSFGPLNRAEEIYFEFGKPTKITGNGKEEHQQIIDFIHEKLTEWKQNNLE